MAIFLPLSIPFVWKHHGDDFDMIFSESVIYFIILLRTDIGIF